MKVNGTSKYMTVSKQLAIVARDAFDPNNQNGILHVFSMNKCLLCLSIIQVDHIYVFNKVHVYFLLVLFKFIYATPKKFGMKLMNNSQFEGALVGIPNFTDGTALSLQVG